MKRSKTETFRACRALTRAIRRAGIGPEQVVLHRAGGGSIRAIVGDPAALDQQTIASIFRSHGEAWPPNEVVRRHPTTQWGTAHADTVS